MGKIGFFCLAVSQIKMMNTHAAKCYAAGILAISYPRPEAATPPLFLVGEDSKNGISDFGGRCEKYDRQPVNLSCASREFVEETLGLVGNQKDIMKKLSESSIHVKGKTANGSMYDQYIIEIQFDPSLPKFFKRSSDFLTMRNSKSNHLEKTTLEWVTFDEMMTRQKRSVFQNTIKMNGSLIHEIGHSSAKQWKSIIEKYGNVVDDE